MCLFLRWSEAENSHSQSSAHGEYSNMLVLFFQKKTTLHITFGIVTGKRMFLSSLASNYSSPQKYLKID